MSDEPLNGFLNVLKPPGMTSAAVVGYARRLLGGAKAGHAGTLDPEAAGVLPLMVGKAARLFDYMQDKEKAYIAEVAFGAATDTQDAQGTVTETGGMCPDEAAIREALRGFEGAQMQRPSAYSAIKHDGHRLYELARRGEAVEAEPREVNVYEIELRRMTDNDGALIYLRCSKGFYVRALCHDLGARLGCPAHMRFLLRTMSGAFTLDGALTLETLADAAGRGALRGLLIPMKAGVAHLPDAAVPEALRKPFENGVPLQYDRLTYNCGVPPREGEPICLWLGGALCAIGAREGGVIRCRSWLAD